MGTLISRGHITRITQASWIAAPSNSSIVEAKRKLLMSGLGDMDVHPSNKAYSPLFVANGVTGVRIMGGRPEHHRRRRVLPPTWTPVIMPIVAMRDAPAAA